MQEGLLANGGEASASTPGAPPTNSSTDSVACESGSQSMSGFLVSWRANIRPKFVPLLSSLAGTPAARNLLLCQVGKKTASKEGRPLLFATTCVTCSSLFCRFTRIFQC